jgi:hypothetical protein
MNPCNSKTGRLPKGCDHHHHGQQNQSSGPLCSASAELLQNELDAAEKQNNEYLPK